MRTNLLPISLILLLVLMVFLFGVESSLFAQTPLRANGKIAFVRDGDIYSIKPDGTDLRRLTFDSVEDNYPAWSPDGSEIAYLSEIPPTGGQALMKIMNTDGSGQRVVTPIDFNLSVPNFCGERFALDWSPDGTKIVFQEFGNIVNVNIDGTNRQTVTTSPLRESEPAWGLTNQITYASSDAINKFPNSGLWIFITTHPAISFSHHGYYTCAVSPDLSADGAKLAYIGGRDLVPPGYIFIANPNPPFNERGLQFFDAMTVRWSPDGNLLVFGSETYTNPGWRHYIEIVDEFGQGRRILTEGINPSWGTLAANPTDFDFDGDEQADISVFRPSDRTWYLNRSTQGFSATQFGLSNDKLAPADFDNDGKTDISVYRDGLWYWLNSSTGSFNARQFGLANDIPVPADYTGDGRAELAVYRNGSWWTLNLSNQQVNTIQFGLSTDKPVPADYDGDGRTDAAVFRNGVWYLRQSTGGISIQQFGMVKRQTNFCGFSAVNKRSKKVNINYKKIILIIGLFLALTASVSAAPGDLDLSFGSGGIVVTPITDSTNLYDESSEDYSFFAFPFGVATDIPVPADYDGDGRADAAVFRESSQTWFIQKSLGGIEIVGFGTTGDKPVASDYDGDGKTDIAIFRPNGANGAEWWVRRSSNGSIFAAQFGVSTDKAVQENYTGDGKADIAIWRPSSGNWFVLRSQDFTFYAFPFGINEDVPVVGDYDGDGKFDAAVFRPSNNTWFIQRSTAGTLIQQFGSLGDLPVPNAFVP